MERAQAAAESALQFRSLEFIAACHGSGLPHLIVTDGRQHGIGVTLEPDAVVDTAGEVFEDFRLDAARADVVASSLVH